MHRHCCTIHADINPWAISGTPSFQQLLEERTPSTQTVVTRVGFRKSFYTVLETTMPMFGSTSGGKSGTASAPEKEDAAASKGAKSKEDTDRGAACSKPMYQRTLCITVWSRSRPHRRGWSQIAYPTRLHVDRTYNL